MTATAELISKADRVARAMQTVALNMEGQKMAADRIIAAQNEALAVAHAALIHADKALTDYGNREYEWGGRPWSDVFADAVSLLRGSSVNVQR